MEFNLDIWQIIQLCVSTVFPLLVGLVTKLSTSGGVRAILLAAIAFATSLGTEALAANQAGQTYDLGQGLMTGLTSFLIAVGMYYGLWKPTGAAVAAQAVGSTGAAPADQIPGNWSGADSDEVEPLEDDGNEDLDESDDPGVTEVDATPPPEGYEPRH
ncbi:Uncharacterised protein [Brevibacterium casei]|uniref:Holin n=1 Tax=Brevibacterium casei TaxID=33889 RepID=A0A449D7K5_9MICO|nr:hypothetical protein [Brevibacterium casei]VEW13581.1 Uncharacterised protein [Brevibacterium casei]